MIDCPNAEIRDRLPDLLHERLDAETRAAVLSHVEACAACRDELALLRELRGGGAVEGPRVDTSAIARAVVARTVGVAAEQRSRARRQFSWGDWRIAAAITVIVLGGTSLATLYRTKQSASDGDTTRAAPIAAVAPPAEAVGSTTGVASQRASSGRATLPAPEATPAAELSMAGGVSDLSESDLRSLLDDIEGLDALPVTEPEPVAVRLAPLTQGRGSSE